MIFIQGLCLSFWAFSVTPLGFMFGLFAKKSPNFFIFVIPTQVLSAAVRSFLRSLFVLGNPNPSHLPPKSVMDDSLYDEFGNYIGPEIESDHGSDDDDDASLGDKSADGAAQSDDDEPGSSSPGPASNGWITTSGGPDDMDVDAAANQIVLAEDKKYYPTAEEVYGEGVEALVMDEDEQPLEQPIIKPVRTLKFEVGVKDSSTYVSTEFLLGLASNPSLVRNVALVGHLQHGKTVFMDMLVEQTHEISTFDSQSERHMRYTDTRIDEQERRISIKAVPMSLVLEDSNAKSYLCNIMDTPGHVNFSDEMTAALHLADGAVLVVDAAEGVMVLYCALSLFLMIIFI